MIVTDQPKEPQHTEDALRLTFVEMLFALAVAQVAIGAADLVELGKLSGSAPAAISHLALALMLIAMSWVGWRQSPSPGMKDLVKRVASIAFVGLLLDVLLVVAYFVISRNSEIVTRDGLPVLINASVVPEAIWICVVFGMYLLWDLVADVFSSDCIPAKGFVARVKIVPRLVIASVFCSAVCLLLSYCVYYYSPADATTWQVVAFDLALVCVLFGFRLLKAPVENYLGSALNIEHCNAFKRKRSQSNCEKAWLLFVTIGYVISFAFGMHC